MENIPMYNTVANAESKVTNLLIRSKIFQRYYIPLLKSLNVFQYKESCIELGCGQGHKLEVLKNSFSNIDFSGLEKSPLMLSKARERLPNTRLLEGDITDMKNIPNESKDIVCLFQVLHHLSEENRNKSYNEVMRILSPNGKVVVIGSFRPEEGKINQVLWDYAYRFYAVLSMHPSESLIIKTSHAAMSIISPYYYNAEKFGYYPLSHSTVFGKEYPGLKLLNTITPKVLGDTIPCISDILIFQKI
ncbi:MAG: class I SAM-dependent methyltransferase [Candidatus Gracilibacteria bacterium]|nr:class I SAM-dependent methyltransferase [Candidatus Gracilibacteria bacterium]